MSVLVAASLPLVALAAWVVWRALRGRPVRRFALNAVVGVGLLVYFAVTAGLGIFWVANQELPVFDLHYLFGYLTAVLVVVHVWINAPLLARFVRKRAPALAAEGQRFRPSVAWAARVVGLAAFGGLCFWIGWSRGVSVVTVVPGEPVQMPAAGGGGEAGAVGMPEVMMRDGGRLLPLSRWYHDRSAHSRRRVVERGPRLDWDARPDVFESYPSTRTIALPRVRAPVNVATARALDAVAASDAAALADVTVAQLGTLLHLTQGITEVDGPPGQPFYKRAAASSGALYPVVTHVVVGPGGGDGELAPGLYHYAPREHALHLVRAGDVRAELAAVSARGRDIAAAPFTIVFSAIYHRSSWKYGERGYRYALLDAGHALANAQAAGAALGWGSRVIGRFDDARVAKLLGVAPAEQGPIVVVPFGAPATATDSPDDDARELVFAPVGEVPARANVPDSVRVVAARTGLALTGARGPPFAPMPPLAPRAVDAAAVIDPPRASPETSTSAREAIDAVIERRRSTRRFGAAAVELATIARLLERARGGGIEQQRALRVYVIAMRVSGLAAGVYEHRADGTFARVRAGDVRVAAYEASLSQEVVERAAAIVVITADVAAFSWPDGSRGFRYAWLDAGVAAGRMYLQAVASGLGVSSVGAFFDDELVDLLAIDGTRELPALLVALGRE
jgi:SagB-type dehydrogenase family enzyme